jgi:acyl-coenzyme A synthetase/AMP-(fatty) acid ligase
MNIKEVLQAVASGPEAPDRPFLFEGLTCAELYGRAEAIQDAFDQAGCAQRPVCLCVEDRGWMTAAMLAALNGGPPLLFPYAYTEQILTEAHRNIAYTHALIDGDHPLPGGVTGVRLPEKAGRWTQDRLTRVIHPDAAWVYLFTGGSTGAPRIWSKSPCNLLLESANLARAFGIGAGDVILSSVPPYHIYGLLYSVLLPLVSGACVSVRTPGYPAEIIQIALDIGATVLVSIPAHYRAMQAAPLASGRIHTAFSSAGALAEQDDLDFYRSTGIAVTEIYGSTETGGIAFRRRSAGRVHLQPFTYVEIKIENKRLRVRSDFLSAELQRDPEGFFLTADRVAPASDDGFEVLGRTDGIIKVGGKRVDLGSIRQALLAISDIKDAYVFSMPVKSGRENEIIAVVAGRTDTERVLQELKSVLPPYSLPRRVKVVDRLPLSAAGKVRRDVIINLVGSDFETTPLIS